MIPANDMHHLMGWCMDGLDNASCLRTYDISQRNDQSTMFIDGERWQLVFLFGDGACMAITNGGGQS